MSPRLLSLLALAALLPGCWMGPWPGNVIAEPRVGFLYVGPVGDHGWTKAHDDGRLYIEEHLPGVTTHYEPSVIPADALTVMDEFVAGGDNIIFTTSYDFISQTQNAAANNPEVNFLNCSGFYSSANMGSYFGRMYQVWYLAGMVAGYMAEETGTDRIGVVGPVTIPETVRHLDAMTLGARTTNPDVVVHIEWINNWFDIKQEPIVTQTLIDAGAGVIVNKTDTTIALGMVEDDPQGGLSLFSIGYDNIDACEIVGDSCLTAPYWNWGPLYTRIVSQMQEGTWDPYDQIWDQIQGDRDDSTVYLAEMSTHVPAAISIEIESEISELAKSENVHVPFVGAIKDNQGVTRVGSGDELSDEELLRMCWYVEGIIDADGQPAAVPGGCGGDY
ncbi:MAG: BMP family ABC transporter substrate-binding protein [Pseudomonadota bacterium]